MTAESGRLILPFYGDSMIGGHVNSQFDYKKYVDGRRDVPLFLRIYVLYKSKIS